MTLGRAWLIPCIALLAMACWGSSTTGRTGDEALVFTVEDLVALQPKLEVEPSRARFERRDGGSGSFKLAYEYQSEPGERPLFLGSYVFIRPDAETAQTAYHTALVGATVGDSGMPTRPQQELMAWGDEHECLALLHKSKAVGQRCIARGGRFVIMLNVSGIAPFEGSGAVDRALAQQLRLLDAS